MTNRTHLLWQRRQAKHLNAGFKMLLFIPGWMYGKGNWVLLISLQLLYLSFSLPILKLKRNLLARSLALYQLISFSGRPKNSLGGLHKPPNTLGWMKHTGTNAKVTLDSAELVNANELELAETSAYACWAANFTVPSGPGLHLCSPSWPKWKGLPHRETFRSVHGETCPSKVPKQLRALSRPLCELAFPPAHNRSRIGFSPSWHEKTTPGASWNCRIEEHRSLRPLCRHTLSVPCRSLTPHSSQGLLPRSELQRNGSIKIYMSMGL